MKLLNVFTVVAIFGAASAASATPLHVTSAEQAAAGQSMPTPFDVTVGTTQTESFASAGRDGTVYGNLDIVVNFFPGTTPTASQIAAFDRAEAFWESQILGFDNPVLAEAYEANGGQTTITANLAPIDGAGGILGSAGSSAQLYQGPMGSVGSNAISTAGNMTFDTEDLLGIERDGLLDALILHEMAHVLGFSDF